MKKWEFNDDIPAEEFDIRPDMIITDKRIITAQEL